MFPSAGPASRHIRGGPTDATAVPYAFVKVTPEVLSVLDNNSTRIRRVFPNDQEPAEIRFGVGDIVSVTLFESVAGGLFIPIESGARPGNFITLPNQAVDTKGNITVPYGGTIRAKGRTVVEVQQAIVASLRDRAIEPQAVVALVDQRASSISVIGEVNTPSRIPANASGERLLDIIARAGGPKNPGHETWVLLDRGGRQASAPFAALINERANNVFIRPQDTIYLFSQPQTFTAFGASGQQGQFPFGAWRLSLSEALGKAGGLKDLDADPASLFLYRGEPREVAIQLGIDCTNMTGPVVPVIYNVNLRDPSGYFLASNFEMRNKDVVFAANAQSVESTKFLTYARLLMGTVNDPIVAAINFYTAKNLATGAASFVSVGTRS